MQSQSTFNDFEKFKHLLEKYSASMNYHDMSLTENEWKQLYWYMDNTPAVTPEARTEDLLDKLDFEIKRGLARRYSFELLLRGDQRAYEEFIQAQNKNLVLEFADFKKLSDEAKNLNPDVQAAIKASCFLTIFTSAKRPQEILQKAGHVLSSDSEEFLSQFAVVAQQDNSLFPITRNLTQQQLDLLPKMYWRDMHFRHMLYTEGADNMTKTFSEGVQSGKFTQQDFVLWKWRWRTNTFGFQGGPGAKYYDRETHLLSEIVFNLLEKIFADPTYSYLDNYLQKRAELAGLNDVAFNLNLAEQQLLGHIAANFHRVNVLSHNTGKIIFAAYVEFKKECVDGNKLAAQYEAIRKNDKAITPTYVTAVLTNAYLFFSNKMSSGESLKRATEFICQFFSAFYTLSPEKKISCMNFSKKSLQGVLEKWESDRHAFHFKLNDQSELIAEEAPKLQKVFNF